MRKRRRAHTPWMEIVHQNRLVPRRHRRRLRHAAHVMMIAAVQDGARVVVIVVLRVMVVVVVMAGRLGVVVDSAVPGEAARTMREWAERR